MTERRADREPGDPLGPEVRALLDEAHHHALADLTQALDLLDAERSARRELEQQLSQALTPAWQRRQVAARALGPLRPLVIALRDRLRKRST